MPLSRFKYLLGRNSFNADEMQPLKLRTGFNEQFELFAHEADAGETQFDERVEMRSR